MVLQIVWIICTNNNILLDIIDAVKLYLQQAVKKWKASKICFCHMND